MFEFIEKATIVQAIGKLVVRYLGFTLFFIITQCVLWNKSSDECYSGLVLIDNITWKLLLLITLPYTIIVGLAIIAAIICSPCIFNIYRRWRLAREQSQDAQNNLMESIFSMKYDQADFK